MSLKNNKVVYWVLTGIVSALLLMSGFTKLSGGEKAVEMAVQLGGVTNVRILGILEIIIVAIWLFPRTGVLGALLAIAYMGGAIAVHFIFNQPVMIPVVIQAVIWLVAAYRFPELTQRLSGKK